MVVLVFIIVFVMGLSLVFSVLVFSVLVFGVLVFSVLVFSGVLISCGMIVFTLCSCKATVVCTAELS